jgi:serine/threonine protein kinase
MEFFQEYGEANRYSIREVVGKGSYGVVCSAVDNFTGKFACSMAMSIPLLFPREAGISAADELYVDSRRIPG